MINTDTVNVELSEWQHADPFSNMSLRGFWLEEQNERDLARRITKSGMVEFQDLRDGLSIRARSYVGKLRIGRLTVTVRPKLTGLPLLRLLRYAYYLRNLHSLPLAEFSVSAMGLQDLLILQLLAEARELIARGLHRTYIRTMNRLDRPRGRFDMNRIAVQCITTEPKLACVYHPRRFDCLPNQVLMSGLNLAARLTQDILLRTECRRLAAIVGEGVTMVELNRGLLREMELSLDRLTVAYRSLAKIIGLLYGGQGIVLDDTDTGLSVPGFLLDMNHFFQTLISRFLRRNLSGYRVRDEYGLKNMMGYLPDYNPLKKKAPTPRPDFIVQKDHRAVAVLDAKYRDLWELSLPREMLYQLAIYALSQGELRQATILYPTLDSSAREARVGINEPSSGQRLGLVTLRPVDLMVLEGLIRKPHSIMTHRACSAFARKLAFGDEMEPS